MKLDLTLQQLTPDYEATPAVIDGKEVMQQGDPVMVVQFAPLVLTTAEFQQLLKASKNWVVGVECRK